MTTKSHQLAIDNGILHGSKDYQFDLYSVPAGTTQTYQAT